MIPLLVFAVVAIILIMRLVARSSPGPRYPIQPTDPWPGPPSAVVTDADPGGPVLPLAAALLGASNQEANTPALQAAPADPAPSPSFEPTMLENPDPPAANMDTGSCFDSGDTGAANSTDSTA